MFREGICFDRPPPQRERREEAVRRHAEREGPAEYHLFTARDCEERTGHRSWGSMRTAEHHLLTGSSCQDKSSSSHPQRSDRSSPRASEAAAAPQRPHPPPVALATRSHHPLLPLLRLPLPSPLQLRRSLRCAALPAARTRRGPVHRRRCEETPSHKWRPPVCLEWCWGVERRGA